MHMDKSLEKEDACERRLGWWYLVSTGTLAAKLEQVDQSQPAANSCHDLARSILIGPSLPRLSQANANQRPHLNNNSTMKGPELHLQNSNPTAASYAALEHTWSKKSTS